MTSQEVQDLLERYKGKLESELGPTVKGSDKPITSADYETFRKEMMPASASIYEKLCGFSGKLIKLKPDKKESDQLQESIDTAHLKVDPAGTTSFSILAPVTIGLLGVMLGIFIPGLLGKPSSTFFIVVSLLTAAILMFPLRNYPNVIATTFRMKASNEMILCIFYLVTYMRHTPNLELAIKFAADHLTGPLSLDLRKVLWDVETQKYNNVKDSMDHYLEKWRKYNIEFIEAFHLIESSLYESGESRRLELLEKSLDVILDETYEKMLHYAHNLKSPITMLHMLGVVLPILGLVILPLLVSFIGGVKWYYIGVFYNVLLPLGVMYLGMTILAQRPSGYGDTDVTKMLPSLKQNKVNFFSREINIKPLHICIFIAVIFLLIGFFPLIANMAGMSDWGIGPAGDKTSACNKPYCFLDYRENDTTGELVGPFGIFSSILSLMIPLGIAISLGYYYKLKSKNVIEIRNRAKKLENEFASGIFQLGNRLGDGIPAETAFGRVSSMMQDTEPGKFFEKVSININKLGLGIEEAIFNPKVGAILSFPSNMITSSMKVLVQSVKKGPKVAAQALINISRYIKEIHRVDERLKDLLADVISSMKSQISVMTPAIAGIVIGITSMITNILGKLGPLLKGQGGEGVPMGAGVNDLFGMGIPTYFFQIVIGLYVVQIIYILTVMVNGIENGADNLSKSYLLGRNLIRSTILYAAISLIVMIIFNVVATMVIGTIFTSGI
ncbi:hypothetical protein HOC35_00790 [Candidatus Woesearchaeota archaeon]|jgi:hypothetical protein|nr:hypothetical protein [Candidatus Woesearchaeota archaeon]